MSATILLGTGIYLYTIGGRGRTKSPIIAAIYRGDVDALSKAIRIENDINQIRINGRTLLTAALNWNWHSYRDQSPSQSEINRWHEKSLEMITLLVEAGADVNQLEDSFDGYSPLICAVQNHMVKVVNFLLQSGADPNIRSIRTGRSAIWFALDKEMYNILISSGADINSQDHDGNTLLYEAIRNGWTYEQVEFLLEKGADPNRKNNNDETPYDLAMRKKDKSYLGLIQNK